MPRAAGGPMGTPYNPYQGTYAPARGNMSRSDLENGLKGIKIKAPNRKLSTQAYKSALPKVGEGTN
jgi:hypothetical protein